MSAMYVTLQVSLKNREARRGGGKRRIAFTRPYTFRTTLSSAVAMQAAPWGGLGAGQLCQRLGSIRPGRSDLVHAGALERIHEADPFGSRIA
ncbi:MULTISPECIES: hypothetical protein [unclassified Stenotrophomonas]|uniref:hypothetical protein n=1 Tax=unclassified Stenotrophomonas TaxID=196198 RepID=UPI000D167E60|nr:MULTISPECIES: hypothetical protein [unclassified Stenotrophomonas]PTA72710.1 hypothetical protein C9412_04430 [Stenotrophomonas sp. Nf1]PTA82465.1 hypothetical protein C9416_04630 [Stenotrophomonas sp. Nf4]